MLAVLSTFQVNWKATIGSKALNQTEKIYDTTLNVLNYSEENGIPTHKASNELAEKRIAEVGRLRSMYTSTSKISGRLGEMYRLDNR